MLNHGLIQVMPANHKVAITLEHTSRQHMSNKHKFPRNLQDAFGPYASWHVAKEKMPLSEKIFLLVGAVVIATILISVVYSWMQ